MLPIAGQTAGPIGLKFFVDTQGWPGGVIVKNSKLFFFSNFFSRFFFPRSTLGPSASLSYFTSRRLRLSSFTWTVPRFSLKDNNHW